MSISCRGKKKKIWIVLKREDDLPQVSLCSETWLKVLYTFEKKTGKLYLLINRINYHFIYVLFFKYRAAPN